MKRIQRKRTKGYRMPNTAKYVGRPTKWGNPLKLIGDAIYIDASHRRKDLDKWVLYGHGYNVDDLIYLYERLWDGIEWANSDMQYWSDKFKELDLKELKGLDLACFCPLSSPCHAEVLLKKVQSACT